jgi:hypothetical protein
MKKPDSVARRLSQVSGQEKPVKPIEITDIARRRVMHRAYIAQMTGELANLANGAPIASSSRQGPARTRALVAAIRESEMPPCRRRLAKWLIARRFFGPAKPVMSRNLMWP